MSQKVQPRIQVESRKDILFLINEFKTFANQSLESRKDEILKQAQLTNLDPALIEQQSRSKIERYIQKLFLTAGDNVEINGRPFHEAFNTRQEYEPIDENIRSRADELQTEVQIRLVELAEIRKKLPVQLDNLNLETIKRITKDSESGIIPSAAEPELVPAKPDVNMDEYKRICDLKSKLGTEFPETGTKIKEIQKLLDDLKVPENPVNKTNEFKRRRSSLGVTLMQTSPRKASKALLARLEKNL